MQGVFKKIIVAIVLSVACASHAQTPIYGIDDQKGTFIQVTLTHDIFNYSHQPDLYDLTVLDAEHNRVPYRVISSASLEKGDAKIISNALPFFPIAADASPELLGKYHRTQIDINDDKVKVTTESSEQTQSTSPEFYLIDLSRLDHSITQVAVEWDLHSTNQYLDVELDATSNRRDWIQVGRNTLVQIQQDDQTLKRNRIDVSIVPKKFEFLRLRILRGADKLRITEIRAEQTISAVGQTGIIDNWTLAGVPAASQTSVDLADARAKSVAVKAWEYTRNETTPLDSFALDLGESTYGDIAKIYSRQKESHNWQLRYRGIWFNAQVGSQWQKSDEISAARNTDAYWRVELTEAAAAGANPQLVFGWRSQILQIISNNRGPFTLAVDSSISATNRDTIFNTLITNYSPQWTPATLIPLLDGNGLPSSKANRWNGSQILFWVFLCISIVVLVLFAVKLAKQLKNDIAPEPK